MRKIGLSLCSFLLAGSVFTSAQIIDIPNEDATIPPVVETLTPETEIVIESEDLVLEETPESAVREPEEEPLQEAVIVDEIVEPEAVEPETPAIPSANPVEDGWVEFTPNPADDLTTFQISRGNETLTGHLRFGGIDSYTYYNALDKPQYYITDADGNRTTYLFAAASTVSTTSTSIYTADGLSSSLAYMKIESYWAKEISPGYTMIQVRGEIHNGLQPRVTLTPSVNGTVRHELTLKNVGAEDRTFGMIRRIDTMLNSRDNVPVYSLGTGRGAYIDNSDDGRRVYFRTVDQSENGPSSYAAGRYSSPNWLEFFGNALSGSGEEARTSELGDVLLERVDTAIYYKWNLETLLVGQSRKFTYDVGLGDDYLIFAPLITVDDDLADVHYGEEFLLTGQWSDNDDTTTTFSYSIDGGPTTTLAPSQVSTLDDVPFEIVIPTQGLSVGAHTITLQSVDPTGNASNVQTVTFNVLAPIVPIAPILTITETEYTITEGESLSVNGEWLDVDSATASIHYSYLNAEGLGVAVIGDPITATGQNQAFELALNTQNLAAGTYSYTVQVTDDTTLSSNEVVLTVVIKKAPIAPQIATAFHEVTITEGETFNVPFDWTDLDSLSGVATYAVVGTTLTGTVQMTKDVDSRVSQIMVDSTTLLPGSYLVGIKVVDETNLVSNIETITLTVKAPVVIETPKPPVKPKEEIKLPSTGVAATNIMGISASLIVAGFAILLFTRKKEKTN